MSLQASGKVYEKRIATLIGGTHIERPNYGQSAPDVEHELLIVECKLRKTLHVETWMQQVEAHQAEGRTCVVIAKQKNLKDNRSIVAMRIPDFLKLLDCLGSDGK